MRYTRTRHISMIGFMVVFLCTPAWCQAPPTAGRGGSPEQSRANAADKAMREVSRETGVPIPALRKRTRVPPNATDTEILKLVRAAANSDAESRQLIKQLVTDVAELKQKKIADAATTALDVGDTETYTRLVRSILESMHQEERNAAEKAMWEQVLLVSRTAGSGTTIESAIEIASRYLILYPSGMHHGEGQALLKSLEAAQADAARQAEAVAHKKQADALATAEQRKAEEERARRSTPWKAGASKTDVSIPGKPRISALAYSPDGKLIAAGAGNGTVYLVDAATGTLSKQLAGTKAAVDTITFSPDSRRVLASAHGEAHLWSATTGVYEAIIRHRNGLVQDAVFSPDGNSIATVSREGQVLLWGGNGKAFIREIAMSPSGSPHDPAALAFSPDGTQLSMTKGTGGMSGNGRLYFLNPTTSSHLPQIGDPTHPLISTRGGSGKPKFSIDGKAFSPGNQLLYSVQFMRPYCIVGSLNHSVRDMTFSPDGRFIATARDEQVNVYDSHCGGGPSVWPTGSSLAAPTLLASLDGHNVPVLAITFSPDGRSLASTSADGQLSIWRDSSIGG